MTNKKRVQVALDKAFKVLKNEATVDFILVAASSGGAIKVATNADDTAFGDILKAMLNSRQPISS